MTAAPTSAVLPRPGDLVGGKYILESLIGQGGMGAVFKAKHRTTGGIRAIKIMLADTSNPEALQRFKNEARAAAEIQNEHVVRVDDVDEEMGYAFMVLEYLDGEDLAQLVEREGRLPPHVAVGYVLQALRGIAQAHAMGIVHRDLKPSNLYLARRKDGSTTVKVLDFGISKSSNANALAQSPSALTSTKAMLGSPLYMSPEQLRSSKSVDQRADIWAVGIILYELLTRNVPFMGENLGELFAAILETDPARICPVAPEVPPDLEAIVLRCLQRNRDNRFQSAQDLMQALAPFAITGAGSPYSTAAVGMMPLGGGTALLQPNQPPPGFTTTPGSNPQVSAPNPLTGSGPRVVGGTVALGTTPGTGQQRPQGITPQPHLQAQTGNAWQSSSDVVLPKSKTPLVVGLLAGFLLLATVGGVAIYSYTTKTPPLTDPTVASGSTTPPDPATATAPPSASTAPAPTATEASATATATASTSATTTSTAAAHVAPKPTHHSTTSGGVAATVKNPPPEPTPTKPPPTPTKPPEKPPEKPPTTPSSNLQNGR